jgi:hypothetical protein
MYKFKIGDIVEVFEDVKTEKIIEGCAKIVKIHKQDIGDGIIDCDVKFFVENKVNVLEDDAVRRQIKRQIKR